MKKFIKNLINKALSRHGIMIAKIHEVDFVNEKYVNLISETEAFFRDIIFEDLPTNVKRTDLMKQLNGTQISEAFYLLHHLHKSLSLNGDICEFGVANGTTSALIANEIKNTNKNFWLFDSFCGLSKPTEKDKLIKDIFNLGSMEKYEGTMSYSQEEVKKRLHAVSFPLKKTKIVAGFIEDTMKQKMLPKQVAFAYVDFDLYEPIRVALDFLDKSLVTGGSIIVDDYGTFSEGAKIAVDEFISQHSDRYSLILPYHFAGYFCIIEKKK